MARERMTILYDLSAVEKALVLGTSNKTELLLGIRHLVRRHGLGSQPDRRLVQDANLGARRPSGGAGEDRRKGAVGGPWEGQTDEHELGFGYRDVDALLYRMVDERWSDAELAAAAFESALIARVRTMVRGSQFKRRLPLIAKISERTIDADFRYPRDWGT
jgi:NAD+ synthase